MINRLAQLITVLLLCATLLFYSNRGISEDEYGWSGKSEGRIVLVPIFISDATTAFDLNDQMCLERMNDAIRNIEAAKKFVENESDKYNVDLIFDIEDSYYVRDGEYIQYRIDSDLCKLNSDLPDVDSVDEFIMEKTDANAILQKNGADGIIYLMLLNTNIDSDMVSTSYMHMRPEDPMDEFCLIYIGAEGRYESAGTYAHEILHCLGAVDLYEPNTTNPSFPVSRDLVENISKSYSDDIMLDCLFDEDGNEMGATINKHIYDFDAKCLGWL